MNDRLRAERADLKGALLAFVAAPVPAAFDALALRVVAWQCEALPPYGRLVAARGGPPDSWRAAPLVPTDLFRELDLVADVGPPVAVFRTSGTTGAGRRGERRVPDLDLYDAAMEGPFVAHVLDGDRTPRAWLSLIPTSATLPDSSLSHMVTTLAGRLAASTVWAMTHDGLDVAAACAALRQAADDRAPVVLLATSFALVALLDAAPDLALRLPAGSRLMLTGGFKGRTREVSEPELLDLAAARLGLQPGAVVPEYGMTELTSQAYGRPLEAPPWLRMRVVDPWTEEDAPVGAVGHVAFLDLLSLDNAAAVLTSDLGVLDAAGRLTLLGRAPDAPARGCSLTAEELVTGP